MIRLLRVTSACVRPPALPSISCTTYRLFSAKPEPPPSNLNPSLHRLQHTRNVGVFAHIDAGKTTVTERMLALAGVVRSAGSVDTGSTVTDYLPAERERGITIQSAAISFDWSWLNSPSLSDVRIHLIDTPGHVDFSVEVNRSVAVLDGAVLVVDSVAGVQAQTETVWKAMTRPTVAKRPSSPWLSEEAAGESRHEPLPCVALVNKMDKEGCDFGFAMDSIRKKLADANPVAVQIPLFRMEGGGEDLVAVPPYGDVSVGGISSFAGVIDLVHMRSVVWPEIFSSDVEDCVPVVTNLMMEGGNSVNPQCQLTKDALEARADLIAKLADVDSIMEEYYLLEEDPGHKELLSALRRATLARSILPVMAGAALRGKGVEPVIDAIADFLPSPLDRLPPAIVDKSDQISNTENKEGFRIGHPLHPSLLALAFKVVHMKGRGGSGDGRVVFARVYSGQIKARDTLMCVTPVVPGSSPTIPRKERVGSMLELNGGRFDNLQDGICLSGDVCALVGLKTVVTGDTLLLASDGNSQNKTNKKKSSKIKSKFQTICLAGVASPKPVITVRVEAESAEDHTKLSHALSLLSIEDPSLLVEETESTTLLSGLGELHIEITLDRLKREYGLDVSVGSPAVAYRETITNQLQTEGGLFNYDRTIGGTRLQASVHIILQPLIPTTDHQDQGVSALTDPVVTIGPLARDYLNLDDLTPEDQLIHTDLLVTALISGCKGSLLRGLIGPYPMANVHCNIVNVHAEGGLNYLHALPGALRAASAHAISSILAEPASKSSVSILEPTMSIQITAPNRMVGSVLGDFNNRRGTVGDVISGDDSKGETKALIGGDVPLVEILGYASDLRSLTAGEGAFMAEYKGHSLCRDIER